MARIQLSGSSWRCPSMTARLPFILVLEARFGQRSQVQALLQGLKRNFLAVEVPGDRPMLATTSSIFGCAHSLPGNRHHAMLN